MTTYKKANIYFQRLKTVSRIVITSFVVATILSSLQIPIFAEIPTSGSIDCEEDSYSDCIDYEEDGYSDSDFYECDDCSDNYYNDCYSSESDDCLDCFYSDESFEHAVTDDLIFDSEMGVDGSLPPIAGSANPSTPSVEKNEDREPVSTITVAPPPESNDFESEADITSAPQSVASAPSDLILGSGMTQQPGSTSTDVSNNEADTPTSPQTGEDTNFTIIFAIAFLSFGIILRLSQKIKSK